MKKLFIPFFAFAALFLFTIPLLFDTFSTFSPAFNATTLLTPNPIFLWLVLFLLLIIIFMYRLLAKRKRSIRTRIFFIHLILSLPIILWLHNPFFFYHGSANSTATEALDMTALDRQFTFSYQLMLIAFGLFFIGQTFFVIDFLKRIKKGRRRTYRNSVVQEY